MPVVAFARPRHGESGRAEPRVGPWSTDRRLKRLDAFFFAGARFVFALALFKAPSMRIIRVVKHYAPRVLQVSVSLRPDVRAHFPYDPHDAGNHNK